MTVFGTFVDSDDVERALLAHVEAWMPTYVAELLRQKDPGSTIWPNAVPPIANYTVVHAANEKWPEDQLPMLLAFAPGAAQKPTREGDGRIGGRFACTLTAIASGIDMADTKAIARVYSTAARACIVQHEGLGGFAAGTEWIDYRNFQVTKGVEGERNLMAVSDMYVIEVDQMLNRDGGPLEPVDPPDDAPPDWPEVSEGGGTLDEIQARVGGAEPFE